MKNLRNIVVFTTLFTILFTSYNIKADILLMDPTTIAGLGDLGMALFSGASFNFTGTKYAVDAEPIDQALARQKAREFVQDYCIMRGIAYPTTIDDIVTNDTKDYLKTYYFDSSVYKAWSAYQKAQTDQERDAAMVFELSNPSLAAWMNYSPTWYNDYIQSLTSSSDNVITIPEQYSYIENSKDFTWPNTNNKIYEVYKPIHIGNYWCYYENMSFQSFTRNYDVFPGISRIVPMEMITLDISDYGESVILSSNVRRLSFTPKNDGYYCQYLVPYGEESYCYNNSGTYNWVYGNNSVPDMVYEFDSLNSCLSYIMSNFAHVNINYNGNTWVDVSNPAPANPLIPDLTDVINKDTDMPAYDVHLPNTTTGEGYFDLTSILDRITQAILDASDNDDATDGTLTVDDVVVLDNEKEETDWAERDIYDVIDPDIDINKKLPIVPLPPGIVDAFQGTSILAELIDGTQQVLPEDLITVFWGIVSTIFIIGLIRVMHK